MSTHTTEHNLELNSDRGTNHDQGRLLRRATKGDQEALNRLFAHYMRPLYQVALRVLRNREDAEDALQDGLLAAVRHLKEFEGRSQFSTWLTRIVINAALMRLRRSRRETMTMSNQELDRDGRPLAGRITDPRPNPEEMCARQEQFQMLEQTWQSLPAAYRSALWLRDVHGMSTGEAAEILGLPEGTLKARLHRGHRRIIKKVREALVPRGNFEHAATLTAPRRHRSDVDATRQVTPLAA